jgi:predicted transcriptional regulator
MVSRSVRFDRATVERLRAVADTRGVGITQMMRQWILDRLEAEEHGRRQDEIAGELERLARQLRATA